jgi:glutamine amidotransferase PdxT
LIIEHFDCECWNADCSLRVCIDSDDKSLTMQVIPVPRNFFGRLLNSFKYIFNCKIGKWYGFHDICIRSEDVGRLAATIELAKDIRNDNLNKTGVK